MSLDRQRQAAKRLLRSYRAGDAEAILRVRAFFAEGDAVSLSRTQLVVARELGFPSWPAMIRAAGGGANDLVDAAMKGDADRLCELLLFTKPYRGLLLGIVGHPNSADPAEFAKCVELLIDAGCDPDAAVMFDGRRLPVVHLAREHGHTAVEGILLARGADGRGLPTLRAPATVTPDGPGDVAIGVVRKRTTRGLPWTGTVTNPNYHEDDEVHGPTLVAAQDAAEVAARACDWEAPFAWVGPLDDGSYRLFASASA